MNGKDDDSDDEDTFFYYGTPLQDETPQGLSHEKTLQDPTQTRALPLHQQEVTDEEGRRRFHGAFTGGFSAGYFNTVGSKEGFTPATFKSSRSDRAGNQQQQQQQDLDYFLDEDEKEERGRQALRLAPDYDTFGDSAAQAARVRAAAEAAAGPRRPDIIPGPLIDELVVPVASGVGVRLLQKMGWRPGRGVGTAAAAPAGGGGKWGAVAGVGVEDTPIYVLDPKHDLHGLGYDPFRDADEFRAAKQGRRDGARAGGGGGGGGGGAAGPGGAGAKRSRGVAFGAGAGDDDDVCGVEFEDYVDEQQAQMGAKGARRQELFAYEDASESDDEDRFGLRARAKQGRIAGSQDAPTLLLTSRQEQTKHGSFIPGFMAATRILEFAEYPPPAVPDSFPGRHVSAAAAALQQQQELQRKDVLERLGPAPPEAPPPADPALRREVETLAGQVARSGEAVEKLARRQAQSGGRFKFLLEAGAGSEGGRSPAAAQAHAYYTWRMYRIRSALAAASAAAAAAQQLQQQQQPRRPGPGAPSRDLSIQDRMALLGEVPLPSTKEGAAGAVGAAAQAQQQQQGRQQVVTGVANSDRQRLQAALNSSFVKGEAQDFSADAQKRQEATAGLWRPPPKPPQQKLPDAAAAFLAGAAGRFAGGSSAETAVLQPETTGLASAPAGAVASAAGAGASAGAEDLPVSRTFEDWRPEPLLCKRFNVPDPYKGRPAPQQLPRFKTEYLALPDTAAALLQPRGDNAPEEQLPLPPPLEPAPSEEPQLSAYPPPPPVMMGEQQQQQHQEQQQQQQQQQAPPSDAAAEALEFLQDIAKEFDRQDAIAAATDAAKCAAAAAAAAAAGATPAGGDSTAAAGAAAAAVAAATAQEHADAEMAEQEAERPLDLFKAIFEADSSEEEDQEEEQLHVKGAEQQQQQQQQQQALKQSLPSAPGVPRPSFQAAAQDLAAALMQGRQRVSSVSLQQQQLLPSAAPTAEQQRRQEIMEALASLKKMKEKRKKKKHKKEKDRKEKKTGKDKGRKDKTKQKDERRHRSGSGKKRRRSRSTSKSRGRKDDRGSDSGSDTSSTGSGSTGSGG